MGLTVSDSQDRWFYAAAVSLLVLIAGTLLYPDTFTSQGLDIGSFRVSALAILFVLTAPWIALYAWLNRSALRVRPLDLLLLATVVFFTARGLPALDSANLAGLTLAHAAYVLLLYYGLAVAGQKETMHRAFFIMMAALAVVISAYALIEFFMKDNLLYGELIREKVPISANYRFHRSGSTLGHPVVLGLFLVQAAPFLVYFFARAQIARTRVAWGLSLVLLALALESSFTRGSWAPAMVLGVTTSAWYLWRYPSARKRIICLLAAVSVSLLAFTLYYFEDVSSGTVSQQRRDESLVTRTYMWERAPTVIVDNALFGVGMWQGGKSVVKVDVEEEWIDHLPTSIDNLYIAMMVEEGLVGFTLMIATLLMIGWQAWLLIRHHPGKAGMAVTVVFSMGAVLLNGMTADTLLIWPALVVFWASAGLIRAWFELECAQTRSVT